MYVFIEIITKLKKIPLLLDRFRIVFFKYVFVTYNMIYYTKHRYLTYIVVLVVHCIVYTVQCTVYTIQYTLYTLINSLNKYLNKLSFKQSRKLHYNIIHM